MDLAGVSIDVSLVSPAFVGGLVATTLARALTPRSWHTVVGVVAAAALIGLGSPATLAMLAGTTLCVVYPLSRVIAAKREAAPGVARAALLAGIVVIVTAWVLFKANKGGDLAWLIGSGPAAELLTVVGFSYFVFRAINVLYMHSLMGEVPDSTPLRMLYHAIFPATVTSGPIHKYADFCREAANPRPLDFACVVSAAERITRGYFYKVCVAALLLAGADRLVAHGDFNGYRSTALMVLMYLNVFFDFAGYSHIAIGFGQLLGVRVPENFRAPFLATSLTEFWRNWHITIGDWFRDHVFIPLGGMRLGGWRAAVFAAAIMIACGLWHGLTIPFLLWGLWHATMLFLEGITHSRPMPPADRHGPRYWGRVLWTNWRAAFGVIFFLPTTATMHAVMGGFLRWW